MITTSKFKVNNSLSGSLYKNHVKYLINSLNISPKHVPFNLGNLRKATVLSKEKFNL